MHKMHKGELVFHLAVPTIILALTISLGYYVVTLIESILKIA